MDKSFEPTFGNMGRQIINLRPLTRTITEDSLSVRDQSASEVERPGSGFDATICIGTYS